MRLFSLVRTVLSWGIVTSLLMADVWASDGGRYLEVEFPASSTPGELSLGVTYTVWIPEGARRIRAVIVHQHGCGTGACRGGATAAYDLHWQALARKWDAALLGPSYHQEENQNCRLWCDPRNGSERTFLQALTAFAQQSGHPELETAPWCLWGHSGGGFWSSLMQTLHPERVVAVWYRSGTAFSAWEKGEIPRPTLSPAVYQVPMMLNPGAKENGDQRFNGAWTGSLGMFQAYRSQGALIGFAPDPRTAHECGDSRYLAIPFLDACLSLRLPPVDSNTTELRPLTEQSGWLAPLHGDRADAAGQFQGPPREAGWLPDERVARAWTEYVKTGGVADSTPPPAPTQLAAQVNPDQTVTLSWQAEADLESGIQAFQILRDGKPLGQLPEKPVGRFGRPLFQAMSYHDTPEKPLPAMIFVDRSVQTGATHEYQVQTLNSAGLTSPSSAPARVLVGKGS